MSKYLSRVIKPGGDSPSFLNERGAHGGAEQRTQAATDGKSWHAALHDAFLSSEAARLHSSSLTIMDISGHPQEDASPFQGSGEVKTEGIATGDKATESGGSSVPEGKLESMTSAVQ